MITSRVETMQGNPNKIYPHDDGCDISTLENGIKEALEQHSHRTVEGQRVNFVGMVWKDDSLAVFFPKGSRTSEKKDAETNRKKAKLVFRCLKLYQRTIQKKTIREGMIENIFYPLGMSILENFMVSGLYDIQEKRKKTGTSGKTDWGRTIKKIAPVTNRAGAPVYIPAIVSKNHFSSNIIIDIHKAIISEADSEMGWLLSENSDFVAPKLLGSRMPVSELSAVKIIRTEMGLQFSEKKLEQLRLMENYLNARLSKGQKSGTFLGTTSFEHVWEEMCTNYFGDEKSKYEIPAVPAYVYSGSPKPKRESTSRPDIVIGDSANIAVIDAKYYDFAISKPGWPDLVKQFFYAKAYKKAYTDKAIKNLFAVPKTDAEAPDKVVVVDLQELRMDDEFAPVNMQFLDPDDVMQCFVTRKRSNKNRTHALNI